MARGVEIFLNEKKWMDDFEKASIKSWSVERTAAKMAAVRVSRNGISYDLGIHVRYAKVQTGTRGKLVFWIINEESVSKGESQFFQSRLEEFMSDFVASATKKPTELYATSLWVENLGVVDFPLAHDGKITTEYFKQALRLVCEFYGDKIAPNEKISLVVPDPLMNSWAEKSAPSKGDLPSWLREPSKPRWETRKENDGVSWKEAESKFRLADMGGNAQLKTELVKLISFYKNREHFSSWNIRPPKGILLYGPPWTGKTLAAKIIAGELEQPIRMLTPADVLSTFYGESTIKLKKFFEGLPSGCIVFVDEIDGLVPNRSGNDGKNSPHEETQRLINLFLQEMDGFNEVRDVLFVGATNRIEALDPAILRAGRFDYKIFVDYPDFEARKEIWKIYLDKAAKNSKHSFLDDEVDVDALAKATERFTWAEIQEVVRRVLNDYAIGSLFSEKVRTIVNGKTTALWLMHTIRAIKEEKVVNRSVIPEKTGLQLADIAWSKELKNEIRNLVTQIRNPEIFEKYGAETPRWLLLYGPPGTWKTHAGKVIASELWIPFYLVSLSDVTSKWHNESHGKLKAVFEWLQDPCVVFFDEIDAIAGKRPDVSEYGQSEDVKVLNTLLMEMDGFDRKRKVLFIGATNRIEALDPAILRAWRFDAKILVWLPDQEARAELFEMYVKRWSDETVIGDVDYGILSEKSEWLSPGDVKEILRRTKRSLALGALESAELKKISTEGILKELENYREARLDGPQTRHIGFEV